MSNILATTYDGGAPVTTSDSASAFDPRGPFAGMLVITAGSGLKFVDNQGNTITMTGTIPVATVIPVVTKQVFTTGTGCTVVGLHAVPFKAPRSI